MQNITDTYNSAYHELQLYTCNIATRTTSTVCVSVVLPPVHHKQPPLHPPHHHALIILITHITIILQHRYSGFA